jgi:predicted Zn finger-like uncharacterized protein
MVLVCPQCSARLQIDDAKAPSRPFSVRCPKCQTSVNHPAASADESPAASVDGSAPTSADYPDSVGAQFERHASARPFNPGKQKKPVVPVKDALGGLNDVAKLLAAALQNSDARPTLARKRPSWDQRKALVCTSLAYRETVAELLANNNYEVFVAENMEQALGRMREERMDVLILDANFDPAEQGVVFITREVRLLRPVERRRLFFVYVTSDGRTMDLHAAFLQDMNLIVNPSDIEELPEALEISMRQFNELYSPLNRALDLSPI